MSYDVALICLNGHIVNQSSKSLPECNAKFCKRCGEPTVDSCGKCGSNIRGHETVRGTGFSMSGAPGHCHECGCPYPWTERKLEGLRETIQELEGLSDNERESLTKSIPDLIADTPKTETAVYRVKRAMTKVGSVGGEILKNVLVKVAAESVKKQLGI